MDEFGNAADSRYQIKYPPQSAGRPPELTPVDHENIVNAYKHTIVLSNVAGLCRRDKATIKRWLDRGFKDVTQGITSDYAQFYIDVKNVLSIIKIQYEQALLAGNEGWQAIAWYLERCARSDYGRDNDLIEEILRNFEDLKKAQEKRDA